MAYLDDLRKSLSEMSDDDLLEHIKQVRTERRIPVKKEKESKQGSAKGRPRTVKKQDNPMDLLKTLTPEQAEQLAKLLGGGN